MLAALASGALVLAGCAGSTQANTITVLAAASLTDVLPEIESALAQEGVDYDLEISYAGSSTIVQQINEGAPADVVLLAGQSSLAALNEILATSEPQIFATNQLAIAVPADGTSAISELDALNPGRSAQEPVTLVVCAEQVPCGAGTTELFANAGFAPTIASYEPDVRAVLAKTASGEADAGIVYATDIAAAQDEVVGIDIPDDLNVTNRYPAFTVSDDEAGATFIADLISPTAQSVLKDAGFGSP